MKENCNLNFKLKGKVVFFATGNIHKFMEARSLLSPYGIAVGMLRIKGDEVQSDSLSEIAQKSVKGAYNQCRLPVIVEDAGLFIDALSGFPGPYAAYAYKTIHNDGILKLMEGVPERRAKFEAAVAYFDESLTEPIVFFGESNGQITSVERQEKGKSGFGFDPIFQPNGSKQTFAEMTIEEKNGYSHRAMAMRKFAEWYRNKEKPNSSSVKLQ
jgi:XTP/dITP diphosphohydrolase